MLQSKRCGTPRLLTGKTVCRIGLIFRKLNSCTPITETRLYPRSVLLRYYLTCSNLLHIFFFCQFHMLRPDLIAVKDTGMVIKVFG